MLDMLLTLAATLRSALKTRHDLVFENLALRHQVAVLIQSDRRRRFRPWDRLLWIGLRRLWGKWRQALVLVQPATVVRWHRQCFRRHWRRKSQRLVGRPRVNTDTRALVRRMATANPLWGAPRIHGELLKLGFEVSERTVSRCLPKRSTAVTILARVPRQSRRRPGLDRLLHGPDAPMSGLGLFLALRRFVCKGFA